MSRLSQRKICSSLILVSLIFVVSFSAGFVSSVHADVNDRVSVIIGFKDYNAEQSALAYVGQVTYAYKNIDAVAASVPRSQIDALKMNPNVAYVETDGVAYALAQPVQWGVTKISAPTVWAGGDKGTGIKVAVLDTGIDAAHSDLRVVGGASFAGGITVSYNDDNGHGTHCAGIIAALDNSFGVVGVAPEASLYAVKVLDRTGSGSYSSIISGIDWCITNSIQVISMSFGGPSDSTALHSACDRAYNAGIVLVAAAGNSGPGAETMGYPARYSSVISVAATDSNDVVASWSSRGTGLSVSAPGVSIYSTYYGNRYATMSGTSMACPHTAGAVALVLKNGLRTPAQVKALLQNTAVDLGVTGYDTTYGYGRINAYAATGGAPPAPTADFSVSTSPSTVNINAAASISSTVTVTSTNGFAGTVNLASSVPAGWTVTFNPTSLSLTSGATASSTATISVPNTAAAGAYTVTVTALNGALSHSATIITNVRTVPSAPQALTAISGNAQVSLSWSAPTSNGGATITNYKIYRSTVSGTETLLTTVGNVLVYTDSTTTNGQPYYYRVTAINSVGESVNSNEASATPSATQLKSMNVNVIVNKPAFYRYSMVATSAIITVNVKDASSPYPPLQASVTLTLYNPDGSVAFTSTRTADSRGNAQFSYPITPNCQAGTYLATASAALSGYQTKNSQTTFLVI